MAERVIPTEAAGTVPFFINGKDCHGSNTFDVTSPLTGNLLHRCSSATVEDAKAAVEAAAEAFKTWRKVGPSQRRDIFLQTAEVMDRRREELGKYMVEETGAAPPFVDFNITTTIGILKDIAGRIPTIDGSIPWPAEEGAGALVLKEPYGVVLGIAPWNAPYILGTRAIAFPIAAGNTAILKASELSPRVMWAIASCFNEAGLPAGVLNVIAHAPSDAAAVTASLISNPHVRKVNFTGSTAVGRIIGRLAGENLKPVLLELGGKAPAIVWDDADLALAAAQCALGSFIHAGQVCMATERILVHAPVRQAFEAKLREAIDKFFPAAGPAPVLVQPACVQRNRRLLEDAVAKGARVVAGDEKAQEPETEAGSRFRMRPVVVGDVTPDMDIYGTESFGPTVSIIEVSSEEEAVRIANDTEYGLAAAVFTEDLRRGLRFAREIETGAVHINGMTIHDEPGLPHGGAKASGFGRFNASALEEWVRTKNVTFKY